MAEKKMDSSTSHRVISSCSNPAIVETRKLTQRKHRERTDCFLVEGPQVLSLALAGIHQTRSRSHIQPRSLFYANELVDRESVALLESLTRAGGAAIAVTTEVLDSLSLREHARGIVATFCLSRLAYTLAEVLPNMDEEPQHADLLLVLDGIQDPGNLGALIRTADAAGVRGVVLLGPCVDAFDGKTVRGTMGSIFTVPIVRLNDPAELVGALATRGYRLIGADPHGEESLWSESRLAGRTAIFLGSEAHGLRPQVKSLLEARVRIPMRGQTESLNVATAGAILIYEWLRRQTAPAQPSRSG
ncbi:MAG: TrmH family RNA methyltransferase [Planctomycetota bacterium]